MKKRNLLYLLVLLVSGQLFFGCNTARHYEFSNQAGSYRSENALVKSSSEKKEFISEVDEKGALISENSDPELSALASGEMILPAAKPTVVLYKAEIKTATPKMLPAPVLKLEKSQKKELKGMLNQLKKQELQTNEIYAKPTVDVLELILAIFIPPLGVLLHEGGITGRFWISLLLTILFFFPGIIYALLVVTDTI